MPLPFLFLLAFRPSPLSKNRELLFSRISGLFDCRNAYADVNGIGREDGYVYWRPDVEIRCSDGLVSLAHSFLLVLHSRFFEAKLGHVQSGSGSRRDSTIRVELSNVSFATKDVVEDLLHWLYKGGPPAALFGERCENVCEIMKLANFLLVDLVVEECDRFIASYVLPHCPTDVMKYLRVREIPAATGTNAQLLSRIDRSLKSDLD
jgi:hypothetical protein